MAYLVKIAFQESLLDGKNMNYIEFFILFSNSNGLILFFITITAKKKIATKSGAVIHIGMFLLIF